MSAGANRTRPTSARGSINLNQMNNHHPITANIVTDEEKQPSIPALTSSLSSTNLRPSSASNNRSANHQSGNHLTSTEILYQALQHSQNHASNNTNSNNPSSALVPNVTTIPLSIAGSANDAQYRQAARPRSAGPSRRPHASDNYNNTPSAMLLAEQYRQQQQDHTSRNPLLSSKYNIATPTGPTVASVNPKPMTLAGTHDESIGKSGSNHPNIAIVPITATSEKASLTSTLTPLANYVQVRPSSASATSRLRQAINDSYRIAPVAATNLPVVNNAAGNSSTPTSAAARAATILGSSPGALDEDGDVVGDLAAEKHTAAYDDDDNDMDGKPFSRSHPEVSLTTPSQSLELGQNGVPGNTVDVRNSSIDSLQDEDIDVGLSTLPNQFCTKRDAAELKKLILMGNNDHGGIVPSSSALMDIYMVGKVIGVGSYGKVRVAWHRLTGAKVAIKTYDKSKMKDQAHWKRVYSEIKIMEQISHPRISRLYEAVETPKRMHLIMECLDGGNLCSYVKQKKRLPEDESKRIFFQILQAVDYLHSYGICHR
jgi:hypothetical protein